MKILASELYAAQVIWKKNVLIMNFNEPGNGGPDYVHKIVTNLLQQKKLRVQFLKQKQGLGIQLQLSGDTKADQVNFARNILKDLI
jgi:hypothetical protein